MPIIHNDDVSLHRYARVQTGASTFIAVAMPEGSVGAAGKYVAPDAALVTAGLTVASVTAGFVNGYPYRVFEGATPSTTANDPLIGGSYLPWSGSTELTGLPLDSLETSQAVWTRDDAQSGFPADTAPADYFQDKLDAKTSSRAPASTALSTAVWTATIAGRIDAAVSSRLAASGYTAPPTTLEISQDVWTRDDAQAGFPADTAPADYLQVKLNAVNAKLPSKTHLAGTNNADGDVQLDEATGITALVDAIADAVVAHPGFAVVLKAVHTR